MSTLAAMKQSRRWLLHRNKKPFYASGNPRSGPLDEPEDVRQLVTYDEACGALQRVPGAFSGIGFALGPDGDGCWQGIDLDKLSAHPENTGLSALLPGYVESSPSHNGLHAIGYGRVFQALKKGGVEAYAGKRFFTFTGNTVSDGPLVDLLDLVEVILRPRNGEPPKQEPEPAGKQSSITLEQLPDLLEYLNPDCDYRDWSSVLAGCRHKFGDDAKETVRNWSKESKKYPGDKEFNKFWRSWKQDKEGGITFGSVVQLALEGGWTHPAPDIKGMFDPVPEAPAAKLPMWDSTPLPDTSATPPPFPDPFPGVMKLAFDAAMPFAHKEQPELMTAAILSGMASGVSGHYFFGNEARCNQYLIGVCETAGGKEFPRQIAERIAEKAGAEVIGAAASGPGIEDALTPYGNLLMSVDEIGFLFAATNAANAQSHLTGLKSILLKLFSVSRGTFNSRNKAGLPGKKIAHPCMNIVGFTTPEILGRAMRESDIASGELPRYMLVFGRDGISGRMVRGRFVMPGEVIDRADKIRIAAGFAKGKGDNIEITADEGGWQALGEQFERYEKVRASSPFNKALISRAYEKCERVAMTLAVWSNPTMPTIDRSMVEWAAAFVDYSNWGLSNFAERHMVAAASISNAKDVLEKAQRIIKGEFETRNMNEVRIIKAGLVPWSVLLKKSRLPANDFRDAIDYLVQSELVEIVAQQFELAASGGSKTVRALRIL